MPSRDPQGYVALLPLPIPSQRGVKIQARSATVFNPTIPSRDEVRRSNYRRRLQQLTSQGFRSVSHKPYQGIGDPFYLEEQRLILHSLGQWDGNEGSDGSSSSEDEGIQAAHIPSPKKTMTAAKFVLRRTRKDLNTLKKEVDSGRNMIRNVKLGHGLFQLIKHERETKTAALYAEKRKKEEEARNAWQAPKRDSDSDSDSEADEELGEDVDLTGYMEELMHDDDEDEFRLTLTSEPNPDPQERDVFSGMGYTDLDSQPTSAKTVPSARRKKNVLPRPYTPQHTNLAVVSDDRVPDMSRQALFRQLCVLNWILEAMNIEQGYDMCPITKSWSFLEIGGSKMNMKKKQREKQAENKWEQFVTNTSTGKTNPWMKAMNFFSATKLLTHKRVSTQKSRASLQRRSTHLYARTASTSMSASPSSSTSQLNMSSGQLPHHGLQDNVIMEESAETIPEEEDATYNKSIFKFLDEYYESLKRESQQEEERKEAMLGRSDVRTSLSDRGKDRKSEHDGRTSRKSILKSPERPGTDHDTIDVSPDKKASRELRADVHFIRPKSSPQLLEYMASLPSNRHAGMTTESRQKFSEILEDKALTLHDILEQMDRERMVKCSSKLVGLKAEGHSFHRTLRDMRDSTDRILHRPAEQQKKDKDKATKRNWFTVLRDSIPEEAREGLWYYKTILAKLERFGMPRVRRKSTRAPIQQVESTSKQSVYKFLKVLETLRDWELCSPDISAAIEFCREKVVEMTVEEYEEWFQQQFPKIQRPQTAPPMLKGKKKEEVPATPEFSAVGAKMRYVQSAFVRRSQT
ncbi:coiled-coil domain-containing protein 60-like isoform X3 [Haliotis rufescens]|uniref:coiled-coil domain-containing protein 60-like isoform X3 n=1 Tax=Haliotis rufescens TaxID=6454 RepID=UPI00201E983A|nr:coiled-coil domain-containing protein 60-like isoform X3 [Haliotis rufescens]